MKRLISFTVLMFTTSLLFSQTIVFHESFELPGGADSMSSSQASTGIDDWATTDFVAASGNYADTCTVLSGSTTYLTSNVFSTSGNTNVFLEFAHICKIDFSDAAEIEVSVNNGLSWTKLTSTQYLGSGQFATLGDKFSSISYVNTWQPGSPTALPDNSWWKTEQFDISSLVGNQAQVKFRFKLSDGGTIGSNGAYGWAIDNIKVTMSFSELIPPVITLNAPFFQDTVYSQGPYYVSADITDASGIDTALLVSRMNNGSWDTVGMSFTSGSAYTGIIDTASVGDTVCYFIKAFDASPVQNSAVDPVSGYHCFEVFPSPPPPGCTTPVSSFPWNEDFETGTAGTGVPQNQGVLPALWSKIPDFGGNFMWMVNTGQTNTTATGPDMDHTSGSGLYVYTESNYGSNGSQAELYSPCLDITNLSLPTLEFYYHMYGNQVDSLCVDIWYANQWINNIWYITGAQQNSGMDPWQKASINLTAYKGITQIRFRVNKSSCCEGDVALDDIKVYVPANNDAGVISVDFPVSPAVTGSQPVIVSIQNFGSQNLLSAQIRYHLNGQAFAPYNWTGNLAPGAVADSLQIGTVSLPAGLSVIKAWTNMPNGQTDGFFDNDTIVSNVIACSAPLSGNYTIGGSNADYLSFQDAVDALHYCGVSGPVSFIVFPGTYNEQIRIDPVSGSSPVNTITFQSVNADSTTVILTHAATSPGMNYTLYLNGADYLRFKHMSLVATSSSYARTIVLDSGAISNQFANNIIQSISTTTQSDDFAGVYSYDGVDSLNTFSDNRIIGGAYGIYLRGSAGAPLSEHQNSILNNRFIDQYYKAIYCVVQNNFIIGGNYVSTQSTNSQYNALHLETSDGSFAVKGNQFICPLANTALNIQSCQSGEFYNNFLVSGGSGLNTTVYMSNSLDIDVYYNSISTQGVNSNGRGLFMQGNASNNIEIKNNIIANPGGGYSIYANVNSNSFSSDYNDLYSSGNNLAFSGSSHSNLLSWTAATGGDSNSVSINPAYATPTNLHTINAAINDLGIPVPGITTDIDGDLRDPVNPDMGADEFTPSGLNAGIVSIESPLGGCNLGNETVEIRITNAGLDTIQGSFAVGYYLQGSTATVIEPYTAVLLPGDSANYVFNSLINLSTNVDSTFEMIAFVKLQNDPLTSNDTAYASVFCGAPAIPPVVNDTTIPYGTSVTLPAMANDSVYWFADDTTSAVLGSGNTFTTPVLFDTIVYYVQVIPGGINSVFDIGTGILTNSTYSYPSPYGQYYNGTREQMLILASELQAAGMSSGPIQSLAFDVVNPAGSSLTNFEVKMGHTSNSSLGAWETGLTSVYQNNSYTSVPGWNTHAFSSSFNWNGTDNIVVETCFDNYPSGYTTNATMRQTQTAFTSTLDHHSDGGSVCTNPNWTPTSYNQRPNMRFVASSNTCPSIRIPLQVNVAGPPARDMACSSIEDPDTDFDLTSGEIISVVVKNYGALPVNNPQISFQVDNTLPVTEVYNGQVLAGDSLVYQFVNTADLSAYQLYNLKAWVKVPGDTVLSNDTAFKTVENLMISYCTCAAIQPVNEDISFVSLGSMNNFSDSTGNTYTDFTSLAPVMLVPGQSFPISVTSSFVSPNTNNLNCWLNVFIDWNRDGVFDAATELEVAQQSSSSNTVNDLIPVPLNAPAGLPIRMRVVLRENGSQINTGPCNTYQRGETEDYFIIVGNPYANDAGVTQIISPTATAVSTVPTPVIVTIKNFGTDTLSKVGIQWSVDGTLKLPYVWIGSLPPDSVSYNITIGSEIFTAGSHCMNVWTNGPNDSTDLNLYNDSSSFCFYSCTSILSGTYTIGGSSADFATINDALIALQNCGVSGPVTFNINSGTYTEQIELFEYTGVSAMNTVTFRSASGNAADVTIQHAASSVTDNFTLRINGADHIQFRDLSLKGNGTVYARVVEFLNDADSNTIEDCIITSIASNNPNAAGIYSDNSNDDYNLIRDNEFQYGYYGLYFSGESPSGSETGNLIDSNSFSGVSNYGIYLRYQLGTEMNQNQVDLATNSSGTEAIYLTNCLDGVKITGNEISLHAAANCNGIHLNQCEGSSFSKGLIANNFILQNQSGNMMNYGIYLQNSRFQDIIHNTVYINGGSANGRALNIQSGASSQGGINIFNNIALHNAGGNAIYVNAPASIDISDYNVFYSSGATLAYWGGSASDLSILQILSMKDSNSYEFMPQFISSADLHTLDVSLDGKGTYLSIASVPKDIDGDLRNTTAPDIGADEFTPSSLDIGALELALPLANGCFSSTESVSIRVKNYGLSTIDFSQDTLKVYAGVIGPLNQTFPAVVVSNGTLAAGSTQDVLVSNAFNMSASGTYYFDAYVSMSSDVIALNDTMATTSVDVIGNNTYYPFTEDFETFTIGQPGVLNNGWTREPSAGYVWQVDRSTTSSNGTGPNVDHTLATPQGIYLYTEANGGNQGDEASLISPCLDLSAMTTPSLTFWCHFYGAGIDRMYIDVLYNGVWNTADTIVGQQQSASQDPWLQKSVDLSNYTGIVKIRFRGVKGSNPLGDMAIDDIFIYEQQQKDAAVKSVVEPSDSYNDVSAQVQVRAMVENYGVDTIYTMTIGYALNGSNVNTETYSDTLLPGATDTFTFANTFNPLTGQFDLCVFCDLTGDGNSGNDTTCISYTGVPVLQIPYSDDMEGINYWVHDGSVDEWERGIPAGQMISAAHSPQNVWMTDLDDNYSNSANAYLYTPKFDMTVFGADTLKFWHYMHSENTNDGGNIQYLNFQGNWETLGVQGDTNATNWYNTFNNGQYKWTGNTGWILSTFSLSAIQNLGNITQFRFAFSSNSNNNNFDGWAIDDFELTLAQISQDAGIIDITSPGISTIYGSNNSVTAVIQNFGYDTLSSVPLKYRLNNGIPVSATWTGTLMPGDTVSYTFSTSYTSPMSGPYNLCVYTSDFYSFNDTTCKNVDVVAPLYDVAVSEIVSPDSVWISQNYSVVVRIKNPGQNTLTSIPLFYKHMNDPVVSETWTGSLATGDSVDFTFSQQFNSGFIIGARIICAYSALSNDGYLINDTLCKTLPFADGIEESHLENFWLSQNIPNPAMMTTAIEFSLPQSGEVLFRLTNMLGEPVKMLSLEGHTGKQSISLNVDELPAGVYYYSIEFEGYRLVKKMVVNK